MTVPKVILPYELVPACPSSPDKRSRDDELDDPVRGEPFVLEEWNGTGESSYEDTYIESRIRISLRAVEYRGAYQWAT